MAGKYSNMDPKEVRLLAEKGDAEAQDSLGCRYVNGDDGFSVDQKLALKWFTMAANGGSVEGMYHLGVFYEAGMGGLVQDFYKAKSWYEKAAERGHSDAQCNLGALYGRGDGVPVDYHKSAYWLKKAADQGNEIAKDNLHELVKTGLAPKSYLEKSPFEIKNGCLYAYKGSDTKLVIPEGVTEIAESCFRNNFELHSVKVPYSLKKIARNAFRGCVQLEKVELGDNLTIIDEYAFSECFELKTISLPKSLRNIGSFAFRNCESLTRVAVPELTKYKDDSFAYCDEIALQKSKGKSSSTQSSASQSNAKSSGLTDKQQQQKDELNRQIEDLRSQAAYYSTQDLSAEDRKIVENAQAEIEKMSKQMDDMSAAQNMIERHKEEQENKRKAEIEKKRAELLARSNADDITVDMFVILNNEKKIGKLRRAQDEFCRIYEDDFATLSKAQIIAKRKEVLENMKDPDACAAYSESFRNRSLKERFETSTRNYNNVLTGDINKKFEEAIDNTAEWYVRDEFKEVRRLLNASLKDTRENVDGQLSLIEKEWKNFYTAKKYLTIVIKDTYAEDAVINENNEFFQMKMDSVLVEVQLITGDFYKMMVTLMNFFPWYWDKDITEIWEAAFNNDLRDETTLGKGNKSIARQALDKIRKKYPPERERFQKSARDFVQKLATMYEKPDSCTDPEKEIKDTMTRLFKDEREFANCRRFIVDSASLSRVPVLKSIFDEGIPSNAAYKEIPISVGAVIDEIKRKKAEERNERDYQEAKKAFDSSNGGNLSELIKAETIFKSLGDFKDSGELLKRVAATIETRKSAQYDEAVSLFNEGTEEAVTKAIDKLDELGRYKDSAELAESYKNTLEDERQYVKAKGLMEHDSLQDLQNAESILKQIGDHKDATVLLSSCGDKIDAVKERMYSTAIDLASEGTESSLKEAITLMDAINPYKDSGNKVKELRELLDNERTYTNAAGLINSREISDLIVAKGLFEGLGNYKDSAIKTAACEKYIDELRENMYQEARRAESIHSLTSQKDAIAKYNKLGDYKDSYERKTSCSANCEIIQEMQGLEKEIEDHKKELASITGAFKKKERKAKEEQISQKEKRLSEIRDVLNDKSVVDRAVPESYATSGSDDVQIDVETVSEAEGETTVIETVTETVTETADIPAQRPVQQKPAKKSKKGLLILIAFMLIAIVAAVLYLTGVLYISPDADNCQIEEYTHSGGTTADKALTIEESDYTIDDYDNLEIVYKITNKSEDDIWDLYGNIAFLDKKDKELCTSSFSYRGLLKPGKSVYLRTGSYEVKSKKIANVKIASYNYSVGQTDYLVDLATGKTEKGASDYEYYSNADYEMANCLTFEINNRGLDEYNYYNVDVTTSNNGTTPVKQVSIYVDFLDKDGNIIDQRNAYIENELGSSRSLMSEATGYELIEGDGSTKLIDSTVINRYEYYLNNDDRYGNNYYSVDLVNGIAYGTHYDD